MRKLLVQVKLNKCKKMGQKLYSNIQIKVSEYSTI